MKLCGHTLVWHQQLPHCVTSGTWTATQAQALLEQHIKTVVGRYQGCIWAWDVVNEAIADGGGYRTDSFWYQHIGPEYIALAFRRANEADPNATLYHNEYEAEALGPKSDAVYALVRDLKQADVPIHGVGWQMHVGEGWRVTAAHRQNAQRLRERGLEVSITAMDVRVGAPVSAAQLASQAESYREVLEFALDTCAAMVIWGFTDKYSWIPSFRAGYGAALPFDVDYRPKPAYDAMKHVLAGTADQDAIYPATVITMPMHKQAVRWGNSRRTCRSSWPLLSHLTCASDSCRVLSERPAIAHITCRFQQAPSGTKQHVARAHALGLHKRMAGHEDGSQNAYTRQEWHCRDRDRDEFVGRWRRPVGPTDDRTVLDAIEYALNVGVTFFDTADVYGAGHSEELLGLPCAGAVTDLSWRARSAGRTLTPSVADCVPQRGEVHHWGGKQPAPVTDRLH